jgi:glycosyltransferase involved in cell wall biosynthesis
LTLIENSENMGFAASVNRGLEVHPERDVVLLNSDTEVANDWLDRLTAAAAGQVGDLPHKGNGTVTPFSNHATICSFPKPDVDNRLPEGWTVAELDRIFRQANQGHRVRIPTAVGFCMYIRRDCWKDAGGFRAEVFGKGYGEENDFCMRALYKGWGHVLAADVFVYHAGATSFGAESTTRRQAAGRTLERLYPEYGRMIADHMRSDPAKRYRIAVSGWRLRHSGRPVILAVSHDLGGGVEQYLRELREMVAGEAEMLLLTPTSYGAVVLRNLDPEDDFTVALDVELDYAELVALLRYCGVTRLHIHHTAGHRLDLDRLRQDLGVPADFSVHDYTVICPQVTLTDAAGRYCGEPDAAGCNACLAARPPRPPSDIASWREKYAPLVNRADRVMAPSEDAAARMRRYFPRAKVMAVGHPGPKETGVRRQESGARREEELVIAVLGVMNVHKGIHRLRACAEAAQRDRLPLRFVLAGYEETRLSPRVLFNQTGPYRNEQLPGLLREMGAQVVWFPAQWPETFSYTLSVSLELGLPVVAPDIGAFAERLAGRSWTWIVPWDWDTGRMLEFFVSVRQENFLTGIAPAVPSVGVKRATDGFYPVEYLNC